jgi:hypothetical protein
LRAKFDDFDVGLIEIYNWGFASEKKSSEGAKALFRFFYRIEGEQSFE